MKRYGRFGMLLVAALPMLIVSNGVGAQARQSSMACDAYARNYAKNASRQGQVLGAGAKGSLLGAGFGAIAGAAGVGAAIGAGIGIIGGGARRHSDAERMYRAAYQDCMAGRVR